MKADRGPSLDEQIEVLDATLAGLCLSFEEEDGEIADDEVLREIECLKATREILLALRATVPSGSERPPIQAHGLN